ncbi:MAG TPA: hypothetical protein PLS49_06925 [Candidatus Woesebacteria bacterium]|nr:hypothetical protein [Candidatus Woesebacteria bacterium]
MEPVQLFAGAYAQAIIEHEVNYSPNIRLNFRDAILDAVAPALGMSLKEGRLAIDSGKTGVIPETIHRLLIVGDRLQPRRSRNLLPGYVVPGIIPIAVAAPATMQVITGLYETMKDSLLRQDEVTPECVAGIGVAVSTICGGGEGVVVPQCPGNINIGPHIVDNPYGEDPVYVSFAGTGIPAGQTECRPGAIDVIVNAIRASNSPAPENQGPTNNGTTAAETQPPIFQQQLYLFNMFPDLRPVLAPEFRMVCVSSKAIENVTAIKLDLPTINEVQAIIGVDPSTANGLHIIDTRNPDDNTRVKDILAGLNRALEGTFFNITDERAILRLQSKDFLLNFKAGELIVIDEKVIENILHYLECAQAQDGIQYVNRFGPVSAPTAITTPEREVTGFGTFLKLFKNLINNFLHGNGN